MILVQQGSTPTFAFFTTANVAARTYAVWTVGSGWQNGVGSQATNPGFSGAAMTITLAAAETAALGLMFVGVTSSALDTLLWGDQVLVVDYDPTTGPGGGTPPTTAEIATAVWEDLLAGGDFGTAGSIGLILAARIDAAISSRSTYAGGAVASVSGAVGSVAGNVAGSVGSVVGAVGSVTGAVGSVTGAVGSVTGAVGSVTGNVGGNVVGHVASVVAGVDLVNAPNATALAAIATAILDAVDGIETGVTIRHALRAIGALACTRTYDGGVLTFTGLDGSTVRVTATIASPGNATVVFSLT